MSANIEQDGTVTQLERPAEPDENITEETVKDSKRLAQFLLRLFREVAAIKRRWVPNRIDFEDVECNGSDVAPVTVRLTHNFGSDVRWWPVRQIRAGTVALPLIFETTETDENTLVLLVYYQMTITFRVEEAG